MAEKDSIPPEQDLFGRTIKEPKHRIQKPKVQTSPPSQEIKIAPYYTLREGPYKVWVMNGHG